MINNKNTIQNKTQWDLTFLYKNIGRNTRDSIHFNPKFGRISRASKLDGIPICWWPCGFQWGINNREDMLSGIL